MFTITSNAFKLGCLFVGLLTAERAAAQTPPATTPSATTTASQQTPNGVEVEVGMGSRIGGPQISNYQLTGETASVTKTLSLTNLGRATPQLLTGLGFSCDTTKSGADNSKFCDSIYGKHLGVFASAQFGSGSNQAITGYSIGTTYALYTNLRLLAGFSMTPVSEVSPGFENAAAQYVAKNPTLFPGVNSANLASGAYGAFDGIQTTTTAPAAGAPPTAVIYYPGSVTETHYRGGFLIGVAFPINVYNLISGNKKSTSQ